MHKILPRYSPLGEQKAVKLPLTTEKFPLSITHQLPGNNPAITQYLHTGEQKTSRRGAEEEQKMFR
jgi:hypothetical protein